MFLTYVTCLTALVYTVQGAWLPQIPLLSDGRRSGTDEFMSRATKLMKNYPMIDGHNVIPPTGLGLTAKDFPMWMRILRNDSIYGNFSFKDELFGHTDIPRLRKGLVGGQFWSVFVPWYNLSNAC